MRPRELTDWFWGAYLDALDQVVEPDALAMGSCAVSPPKTTKRNVSGAAYIAGMGDICCSSVFDPISDPRLKVGGSAVTDPPSPRIPIS